MNCLISWLPSPMRLNFSTCFVVITSDRNEWYQKRKLPITCFSSALFLTAISSCPRSFSATSMTSSRLPNIVSVSIPIFCRQKEEMTIWGKNPTKQFLKCAKFEMHLRFLTILQKSIVTKLQRLQIMPLRFKEFYENLASLNGIFLSVKSKEKAVPEMISWKLGKSNRNVDGYLKSTTFFWSSGFVMDSSGCRLALSLFSLRMALFICSRWKNKSCIRIFIKLCCSCP